MGTNQKTREQATEQAPSHHHHDHKLPNKYLDGKETKQTRAKQYKVEGQEFDFAPTLMIPLFSVRDHKGGSKITFLSFHIIFFSSRLLCFFAI